MKSRNKKVNVVSYKDNDRPGLRFNWVDLFTSVVLLLATVVAVHLRDTDKKLYTGWALFAFVLLLAFVLLFALFTVLHRMNKDWWSSAGLVLMGILIAVLLKAMTYLDVGWKAVGAGLVTFVVISAGLTFICLTSWWPHGVEPKNRGES